MKKFITLLLLLFISALLSAEGLEGIYNTKFGDNEKIVFETMRQKGWSRALYCEDTYIFTKRGGTYAGHEVNQIKIDFINNKMYEISIFYNNSVYIGDLEEILKIIAEKFELEEVKEKREFIDINLNSLALNPYYKEIKFTHHDLLEEYFTEYRKEKEKEKQEFKTNALNDM